jgi:ribosomal protein S2
MKNLGEKNNIKFTATLNSLLDAQFHFGNNPNQLHPSMDSFVIGQIHTKERIEKGKKSNKFKSNINVRVNKKSTKNLSYQSKSLNTFSQSF